jgi:hypothetical protein
MSDSSSVCCVGTRTLHLTIAMLSCACSCVAFQPELTRPSGAADTLHRFCKKEHDWGWKKFMELNKVLDGFTVDNELVIKAQVQVHSSACPVVMLAFDRRDRCSMHSTACHSFVSRLCFVAPPTAKCSPQRSFCSGPSTPPPPPQVIRDTTARPFRCLDAHYRRELVRVYIANVETLCRHFIEERREQLSATIGGGSPYEAQQAFHAFWKRLSTNRRGELLQVRACHAGDPTNEVYRTCMHPLWSTSCCSLPWMLPFAAVACAMGLPEGA